MLELMPPNRERVRYNVFIGRAQLEGMRFVQERDGILPAEQIRRAIDVWLVEKGVSAKTDRKRAVTRKRA
jgi:hypothetical protein